MLDFPIPGRDDLVIYNVVFDFNGTLATDGKLLPTVKEMINILSQLADIYILSSDTYDSVNEECKDLNATVHVVSGKYSSFEKRRFVNELGTKNTICIGNGMNDIEMFEICALSIIVIGDEGCSAKAFLKADIVVKEIKDALLLLLNPKRITATMRN